MKLDNKEKTLLALYAEYCRDDTDFSRVNALSMEMALPHFNWALMKLQTEGLITGVSWLPPGETRPDKLLSVSRERLMLTGAGVDAADALLDTRKARSAEKLQRLYALFADLGLSVVSGIIGKALGL